MKRKRQSHTRVAEVGREIAVHRAMRTQFWQRAYHGGCREGAHAVERGFKRWAERRELGPVVGHEAGQGAGILGTKPRHRFGETRHVPGGLQLTPGLENQMVLRIEADQFDLAFQGPAARGEDIGQHPGIQEERRPHIETERAGAVPGGGYDGGGPATRAGKALENRYVRTRPCEQHRGRKPAGPSADDADPASLACSRRKVNAHVLLAVLALASLFSRGMWVRMATCHGMA